MIRNTASKLNMTEALIRIANTRDSNCITFVKRFWTFRCSSYDQPSFQSAYIPSSTLRDLRRPRSSQRRQTRILLLSVRAVSLSLSLTHFLTPSLFSSASFHIMVRIQQLDETNDRYGWGILATALTGSHYFRIISTINFARKMVQNRRFASSTSLLLYPASSILLSLSFGDSQTKRPTWNLCSTGNNNNGKVAKAFLTSVPHTFLQDFYHHLLGSGSLFLLRVHIFFFPRFLLYMGGGGGRTNRT